MENLKVPGKKIHLHTVKYVTWFFEARHLNITPLGGGTFTNAF